MRLLRARSLMDIEATFKLYCGKDVQFISEERIFREVKIRYKVPRFDPGHIFTIRCTPGNGMSSSIHRAVLRAADSARQHAYRISGQMAADTEQLLQGKLVDEHPRSDAQAGEIGTAAAVDPEP